MRKSLSIWHWLARRYGLRLLSAADIAVNGSRPWDLQVHDERLYLRCLLYGSLGFGEAYLEGWWDCEAIDELVCRLLTGQAVEQVGWPVRLLLALDSRFINRQGARGAFVVGQRHYDLGSDLYGAMLDRRLIYSCAYWDGGAQILDEAQEAKLKAIAAHDGAAAEQINQEALRWTLANAGPIVRASQAI
ncbi:class I SAM-dependent methyltransferase [Synechococcus sp. OH20]|uniref:class I SAM-dependent methyltransferase n=1 Tax=Synechococcus sp. OH20 TaxID=139337 RepID=UPI0039C68400